jgi:phage/plasmid primase-like uncharacterized protein
MIDKHELKSKAAGQWDRVISILAPTLAPALEHPGKRHIDCPMHGGKKDFRVYRDVAESGGGVCTCGNWPDGIALIGAANSWTFRETLEEVGRLILGEPGIAPIHRSLKKRERDTAKEDTAIRQRLLALWNGGIPWNSPASRTLWLYLRHRGLKLPRNLQHVRFNPSMLYYEDGKLAGRFPGLMARVMAPDGKPVTLHRTFLTGDGQKAPVSSPKKLCSHATDRPLNGAAIRLFPADEKLAVAEGIETALAVTQLTGIPCWATVSAGLMAEFIPPKGVKHVVVYADKDRPSRFHPDGHGQEAAKTLIERLWRRGIHAGVRIPPGEIPEDKKGIDWLDVLTGTHQSMRTAA